MPADPRPEHLDEARALTHDWQRDAVEVSGTFRVSYVCAVCDESNVLPDDALCHVRVARALAQREADALERAAKVCDDLRAEQSARYDRRITRSPRDHASLALYDAQANAAGHLASRIRSLTPTPRPSPGRSET